MDFTMDFTSGKVIAKLVGSANLAYFGLLLFGRTCVTVGTYYVCFMDWMFNLVPELRVKLEEKHSETAESLTDEKLLTFLREYVFGFVMYVDLTVAAGLFIFFQLAYNLWFTKGLQDQFNLRYCQIWMETNCGPLSPLAFLFVSHLLSKLDMPKVPYIDYIFLSTHVTFIGIFIAIVYALRDRLINALDAMVAPLLQPVFANVPFRSCRKG